MKPQAKNLTGSVLFTMLLLIGIINIAGSSVTTANAAASVTTADAAQKTFSTPEQAGQALRAAAAAGDESTLAQILGPDSKAILTSGDAAEDKAALAKFTAKYDRMNRWVTMTDGTRVLYIGADNYPYPIPMVQNASSQWYFNTAAGKDEILARRIGKNELLAIDAVCAMGNAEELYNLVTGQYTDKVLSAPGRQDGLYWEVPADQASSPLGRLNEFAKDVVTSTPAGAAPIFDGYSFRIIAAQSPKKSFTIVASPVNYGDSGIMTFILNQGGVLEQKDLGPSTTSVAAAITSYNPNVGWTPAE